ncbi:MAG: ABC transporter ATP-binding protein [Candidatus Aerophobetes bacterium]|nr:ABC transporter ATP-binding protein [Candidatus Aerophobetes bacterium]
MSLLKIGHLTKKFGGLVAVNEVNFHIEQGEIISLIGPNGAGKTTILNIITGFYLPTNGKIFFKGKEIIGLRPYEIAREGIIRTFQRTHVFPEVSILENVLVGYHSKIKSSFWSVLFNTKYHKEEERNVREKAQRILDFLDLSHKKDELAKNLPYGEQRLIEIAVALMGAPDLLLVDEPATGMNPEETKRLTKVIGKIRDNGVTILLIEHDMKVVMDVSDRIIVLDSGRKIIEGLPEEIKSNERVIEAYLGREDIL